MNQFDAGTDFTTCVHTNGVFTGCRVLVRGEPIWPASQRVRTGEVIVTDNRVEGGLGHVNREGSGTGR
ncbi:MAG: hypothetical protein ACYC5Y_12225 [Symbiobacteriia bacterium]